MDKSQEYSANLTGEPFLYYELKQVAKLRLEGLNEKEIRAKINAENLFQYNTSKSNNKRITASLRRTSALDSIFLDLLVNGSLSTSKQIALIAIMKTNRLFYEFMMEVYREKAMAREVALENKDFRVFFTNKAEQDEKVASWKDYTINKLRQVYQRILFEAGLIRSLKSKEITPPIIETELANHLKELGEERYLEAMAGVV